MPGPEAQAQAKATKQGRHAAQAPCSPEARARVRHVGSAVKSDISLPNAEVKVAFTLLKVKVKKAKADKQQAVQQIRTVRQRKFSVRWL